MTYGVRCHLVAKTLDGVGIYGTLVHFTIAAAFFGSALLLFIYLWRKGRLDMNEGPARRMLDDDERDENEREGE